MSAPKLKLGDIKKKHFKKGIGMTTKAGSGWREKLDALQVSWHYSWGSREPQEYPQDVDFVPMVWGQLGIDEATAYLKEQKQHIIWEF